MEITDEICRTPILWSVFVRESRYDTVIPRAAGNTVSAMKAWLCGAGDLLLLGHRLEQQIPQAATSLHPPQASMLRPEG